MTAYQRSPKNVQRAEAAEDVLTAYANRDGSVVDLDTVRDLIQDLMHWQAQREGVDPSTAVDSILEATATAARDFPNEFEEEESR
jgi:chromosomal replication initiation ATPase DnaA